MTILKDLLYTISSLPQIMSVSSANTTNENIDVKNLEKLLCFMNTQENTIKKIISGKGFYQKRFDTLTLEEKKNFFKEVIKNSVTTDEQKNVIEETKQHGDYYEDGYGGQNILFKNLDENKIYTLEEMLAMPNQYLLMYKLIKVHDKNKGWYIRSLPNDIKEDNLG